MIYDEVEWSSGIQDVAHSQLSEAGVSAQPWPLIPTMATTQVRGQISVQALSLLRDPQTLPGTTYYNYINRYNRVDEENLKDYLLIEGSWEMCSRV